MYAIENVGHILEKVRLDQTLEGGEGVSGRESRERGSAGCLCFRHPLRRWGVMVENEVPELRGDEWL